MATPVSPILVNEMSARDFRASLTSLLSRVDGSELSPVQGFDILIATAAEFRPLKSSGLETPAYAESRVKSQALDEAFDGIVRRALVALPSEPGMRKAILDHLYTKLKPFAARPEPGETRWMGTNINQSLYDIAKQQEVAGEAKP